MANFLTVLSAVVAGVAALLLLPPTARGGATGISLLRQKMRARRRQDDGVGETADAALLLDLTAALLTAGVGIEAALARLASTVPGAEPLAGVHRALAAGASWDQAAELVAEYPQLRTFCDHMSFAYSTGAPSARMLRAAAGRARAELRHAAEAAAEKLGVKMMLPLGACFLPAFILVGVVPVVVSMLPEALGF
ncbi:type II secretion system F family protein [Nesterenkonia salmonea]|uniref:Type II secretion system F family protein n=1 Tax=Nesterenkonia salmonea TaxID=1804987 RepID=A0A5R9BLC5_9MICC|nr:type II secretion system F family protein [Nesterenkonia salmonea]TLQ01427.1 type II secretion system F family protein [Nesterenkonia salmonea]